MTTDDCHATIEAFKWNPQSAQNALQSRHPHNGPFVDSWLESLVETESGIVPSSLKVLSDWKEICRLFRNPRTCNKSLVTDSFHSVDELVNLR